MASASLKIGVASLNVNGIRSSAKRTSLFNHFRASPYDIICFQETHILPQDFLLLQREWLLPAVWNPGTAHSCGVGILFTAHKTIDILDTVKDDCGRILILKLRYDSSVFQVCTVYAPTTPDRRGPFFTHLATLLFPNVPTIMTGDFNMVEDPCLDRLGASILPQFTAGLTELRQLIIAFRFVDSWREINPSSRKYTWPTRLSPVQSRLDRMYVTEDLHSDLLYQDFCPTVWSDHKYIAMALTLTSGTARGPNYWKLNTTVLTDPDYQTLITTLIANHHLTRATYSNILPWWENCKLLIKAASIVYCRDRCARSRALVSRLKRDIDAATSSESPDAVLVDSLYAQLRDLQLGKDRGAIIRSRERILLNNEQPSKFFFLKERTRQHKKHIAAIKVPLTPIPQPPAEPFERITDPHHILTAIWDYYDAAYASRPVCAVAQRELLDGLHSTLPVAEATKLDGPLLSEELLLTVQHLEENKTPGIDGLPVEFYSAFWGVLQPYFLDLANYIFTQQHTFSYTQHRAVLALQFKVGDRESLDNWRPISLLCVDYKIITKTLATRLGALLHYLLHPNQTCSVSGRSIYDNLYLLRDIISHSRKTSHLPTYLISLDIKRAFDSIDHLFLYAVLTRFGVGPRFLTLVQHMYTGATANIMNNGSFSMTVTLRRGIRQGCPLSLLLYCLVAETVASHIRDSPRIRGYFIPGKPLPVKLSQYADDTVLISKDVTSINHAFVAFAKYARATGCRLNPSKVGGLVVAHDPRPPNTAYPITWKNDVGMKILGVIFYNDYQETVKRNWLLQVTALPRQLSSLISRTLSFRGKVILINSLILSRIWFLASILHLPKWAVRDIEKAVFTFLWGDKGVEPIKRSTLYLPVGKGGLGLLHPQLQNHALTMKFFHCIVTPTYTTDWVLLARYWMGARLPKHNPAWSFLSANRAPKYKGTDPPVYWVYMTDLYTTHRPAFIANQHFTAKSFYTIFQRQFFDGHKITSERQWAVTFQSALPWKTLWSHTYVSYLKGRVDDTLFRILHHSYPTGVSMQSSRQRSPINPYCKYCQNSRKQIRETLLHIFARCSFAKQLWTVYKPCFTAFQPDVLFQYERTVLTLNLTDGTVPFPLKRLIITLTNLILTELWTVRNKYRYDRLYPNLARSCHTVNSHLKFLLNTQYERHLCDDTLPLFTDRFLIGNVFGVLTPRGLHLTLPQPPSDS